MTNTEYRTRLMVASGLLLVGACGAAATPVDHAPMRHVVEIRGMAFVPALETVAPGDTIVFINRDLFPHTATPRAGGWDSGQIASGDSAAVVMRAIGDAAYRCELHPTMLGTIRVVAAGAK